MGLRLSDALAPCQSLTHPSTVAAYRSHFEHELGPNLRYTWEYLPKGTIYDYDEEGEAQRVPNDCVEITAWYKEA